MSRHWGPPYSACRVEHFNIELFDLFIQNGADFNEPHQNNEVLFHRLLHRLDAKEVLELLLQKGNLNLNLKDKFGRTAFHKLLGSDQFFGSRENAYLDLIEFLLENNADINAKDKEGRTPLDYIKNKHRPDLVSWLRAHGAK